MEIKAATGDITKSKAGAILVSHYEGVKSPEGEAATADKALAGAITNLIKQGDIKGKLNEITVLHSLGKLPAGRIVVVGMGKKKELTANKGRGAIAEACRYLRGKGVTNIAAITLGANINGIKSDNAVRAMTEGALLGLYTFKRHMTKKENNNGEIKELTIYVEAKSPAEKAIARGKILAEASNRVRDLVNEPSNFMTPADMATEAKQLAKKYGLKVEVFEKDKIKEMGMGGLLGVSQGRHQ